RVPPFLCFLRIPRPPSSPLFPYTTLFRSMVSEPQRRALRLLASSADGVTEALLLANGVSIDVMVEIINAGLAVAHVQQLARPRIEVTVLQITPAVRPAGPIARAPP